MPGSAQRPSGSARSGHFYEWKPRSNGLGPLGATRMEPAARYKISRSVTYRVYRVDSFCREMGLGTKKNAPCGSGPPGSESAFRDRNRVTHSNGVLSDQTRAYPSAFRDKRRTPSGVIRSNSCTARQYLHAPRLAGPAPRSGRDSLRARFGAKLLTAGEPLLTRARCMRNDRKIRKDDMDDRKRRCGQ